MNLAQYEIYIDFDGTICPAGYGNPIMDVPPYDNCKKTIDSLIEKGARISIYSCRSNPDVLGGLKESKRSEEEMINYLKKWDITYHDIVPNKPHFHIIIDDRAITCNNNWKAIEKMFAG